MVPLGAGCSVLRGWEWSSSIPVPVLPLGCGQSCPRGLALLWAAISPHPTHCNPGKALQPLPLSAFPLARQSQAREDLVPGAASPLLTLNVPYPGNEHPPTSILRFPLCPAPFPVSALPLPMGPVAAQPAPVASCPGLSTGLAGTRGSGCGCPAGDDTRPLVPHPIPRTGPVGS